MELKISYKLCGTGEESSRLVAFVAKQGPDVELALMKKIRPVPAEKTHPGVSFLIAEYTPEEYTLLRDCLFRDKFKKG